ncbi:hypothetical protein C8Q74DRAFT_983824 [Fomes fomentarius]|nr:hypothetical protein C8Q74DRAFT_983824 [Fomes fomentarius]
MAPPPRTMAVHSSIYDDTDSAVVYHGSWTTSANIPGLYNHTVTETIEVGDTAVFNFVGSNVRVFVELHRNQLESSTYTIDGEVVFNYTSLNDSPFNLLAIFESPPLLYSRHELVVTNYGDALSLDKFVVTTTTPNSDLRRPSGKTPGPSHSSDPPGSKQVSSLVSSDILPEPTISLSSTGLTPPNPPTITSFYTPLSTHYSSLSARIPSRSDSASSLSGSSSAVPSSSQTGAISKGAVAGATIGAILCCMAFAAAILCFLRWCEKWRCRIRSVVTSPCCPFSERVEIESREPSSSKPTARAMFAIRRARRHSATVSNAGSSVSVALPEYGYIFHEPQVLYGSDLDGPSVDSH